VDSISLRNFELLPVMGGLAMEEMPLSVLFEQARKIHLAASESGVDQVEASTSFLYTDSIRVFI
jgi:hypothetical protein